MENIVQSTKKINIWKAVTLKAQLNIAIIKSGYAPSHSIMSRVTIIKQDEREKYVEKFYLDYGTERHKLLLHSILMYDAEETPLLLIERCDRVKLTVRHSNERFG